MHKPIHFTSTDILRGFAGFKRYNRWKYTDFFFFYESKDLLKDPPELPEAGD